MKSATASARTPNFPAESTSFVGRRRELQDVKRLLGDTRLLTLTGSGGVGKTRLALAAAMEVARGFRDGVWFAPLAPIDDPLLISQAIFAAFGAQDRSSEWSLVTLTNFLSGKRLLLVIDNCEHLLDACAVLATTLLKACPELHLLVTSRQPLSVPGESRFSVPPMSLPAESDEVSVALLAESEAARLLTDRAGAVLPGFRIDAQNAEALLRVCRRLDGIPLALELAAVRLGALSLEQLDQGLGRSLSVLAGGNRGAEPRQQTLEAALAWSYALLGEAEQALWARVSVFAGGFDADAAAEVCSDDDLIEPERVVDLLGGLVEKSILRREMKSGTLPRYSLLQTLRQFGKERLGERREEIQTYERHLQWVVELARYLGAFDDRQLEFFGRMDIERNNVWAALEFALRAPESAPRAAELARHLVAYWTCRGPFGDLRRILTALALVTEADTPPQADLLRAAAVMANGQNDSEAREAVARDSLRAANASNDAQAIGLSLAWLAIPLAISGSVAEATEAAESAVRIGQTLPSEPIEMVATAVLCNILQVTGRPERAIELGHAGIAMCERRGEVWARSYILNATSQAHWRLGELDEAEAEARAGSELKRALDDRSGLQLLLETLAWMAAESGREERAATLIGSAEHVRNASAIELSEGQRPQRDRAVALALEALGQREFDAAFATGLAMSLDDAVLFATDDRRPAPARPPARLARETSLTKREREVARLIAKGKTSRAIASNLFISERTVEAHVTNMLNKLGLNSRLELARWLTSVGGTDPDATD